MFQRIANIIFEIDLQYTNLNQFWLHVVKSNCGFWSFLIFNLWIWSLFATFSPLLQNFLNFFLRHCIFEIWKCNAVLSLKISMFSNLGFHLSYNTSNWRVALAHFLKQSSPIYKRLLVIHSTSSTGTFFPQVRRIWPLEPPQTKHQFWNGTVFSCWCPWRDSAVLSPSMITRPTKSKFI